MNSAKLMIACSVLLIFFFRYDFALLQKSGASTGDKKREKPLLDYEVKVKLIARLVFFCKWPPDSGLSTPAASLTVGAFEKNDMIEYLIEETKTKSFAKKNAKIVIIKDDETIKTCNVLIINDVSKKRLKKILDIVDELPILTVADTPGYAKRGVMISLFMSEKKLAFNVNHTNMRKCGLHLPSRVLSVAESLF